MRVRTIHLDLRKHRKRHVVFQRTEFLDLSLGFGLLRTELIAREAQHNQASLLVFIVERLKLCVLACENTLARYVHNQQHRALVLLKRNGSPVNRSSGDIVKRYWNRSRWQSEPQVNG